MSTRFFLIASLLLSLSSCGLEQPILNEATEGGPDWVPDAPDPYVVRGQVFALPGALVEYTSASGVPIAAESATADSLGFFNSEWPGSTEYRNVVVTATSGATRIFGLAMRIPRNESVYHSFSAYHLGGMTANAWGDGKPVMSNLDDRTTAMTLILLRKAYEQGIDLGTVTMISLDDAMGSIVNGMETQSGPHHDVLLQVQRLLAAAQRDITYPPVFLFPDASGVFLNPDFLESARVDYSGDGRVDLDVTSFEVAMDKAGADLALSGCEVTDRVTVVFMVDINDGVKDLNCGAINHFKFATDEDGKRMFITGAMYTQMAESTTPACEGEASDGCLTQEEWAETNDKLGNWIPNRVPLRDDGQGGDAIAADNIWTLVLDLPYIPVTVDGVRRKGVRLGYKYTYGFSGQGWTTSEEWPGNNRVLELNDVNGDGLVVRYDYFADEAANKNVANVNKGLCGGNRNPFYEDALPGCFSDTEENRIDTDNDCVPDTFPTPGAVVPRCEGDQPRPVKDLTSGYLAQTQDPVIANLAPSQAPNGGGALVTLSGSSFRTDLSVQVNTADSMDVANNEVPGVLVPDPSRLLFLAPPFAFADVVADVVVSFVGEGDAGATPKSVSTQMLFDAHKTVDCSLAFPESMPAVFDGVSVPAGTANSPSYPVVARLMVDDPQFSGGLRVEVGLSQACCDDGDTCLDAFGPCYSVSDPRFQDGWTFHSMDFDPQCATPDETVLPGCVDGESQFLGSVLPPLEKARYKYAIRYSFDDGLSWDFCDLPTQEGGFGNEDGFRLSNAGEIWVE